jgi:hypothetical protein
MPEIRKLKAVRVVVRPDKRGDYLKRFLAYAGAARSGGAQVRLFEDQVLPGRFLELTEHRAAEGMEGMLEAASEGAALRAVCVRREGDDVLYREVDWESGQ